MKLFDFGKTMRCKVSYCEYLINGECIDRIEYNACGRRKDYEGCE